MYFGVLDDGNYIWTIYGIYGLLVYIWCIIELDDGKILTGKPDQFDGKNPWVSGYDFPLNQSNECSSELLR